MNDIVYKNKYINIINCNGIIQIENIFGGSVILPITEDNKVILIEIFREPIGKILIEAHRGFSEEGENSLQTAKRELYEELHCSCEKFISLGYVYPDTGLLKSKVNIYLALNAKILDDYVQIDEKIKRLRKISFKEAYDMAINGKINDTFTIAAILRSINILKDKSLVNDRE